jgi:hypothetical protein
MSGYGDAKKIPEEEKETVRKHADGLSKLDRKVMMDEFKKGLDKDDVDPREYMKLFRDFGLLDHLFPGKQIDADLPKELSEIGDKHAPIAWALRMNDPATLEDLGMDPQDLQKVKFLIKSLSANENMDPNSLDELTQGFTSSGISSRKLREFVTRLGGVDPGVFDAFISYAKTPRVSPRTQLDDGTEQISSEFQDLTDPFSGETDHQRMEERKKSLEHRNFRKHLEYMRPQ